MSKYTVAIHNQWDLDTVIIMDFDNLDEINATDWSNIVSDKGWDADDLNRYTVQLQNDNGDVVMGNPADDGEPLGLGTLSQNRLSNDYDGVRLTDMADLIADAIAQNRVIPAGNDRFNLGAEGDGNDDVSHVHVEGDEVRLTDMADLIADAIAQNRVIPAGNDRFNLGAEGDGNDDNRFYLDPPSSPGM